MAFVIFLIAMYLIGIPVAWYARKKLHSVAKMEGDLDIYILFSWLNAIPAFLMYLTFKYKL